MTMKLATWFLILALLTSACGSAKGYLGATPGPAGPKGDTGANGADGVSCSERMIAPTEVSGDPAQYGGAQITCGANSTLITNGAPGRVGATGAQGVQGTPGTSVTAVQFCSAYVPSYASSFPEVGFCLNNTLYGVYWDGRNAWLSSLPPGGYYSTSTGAPCNFTIGANCTIQ